MSAKSEQPEQALEGEGAEDEICASCGIAGVDDTRLKFCDDCDLVKYCGDGCQENHREQHEDECKKRRAELHGKHLFDQPDESHLGECPGLHGAGLLSRTALRKKSRRSGTCGQRTRCTTRARARSI